LEEDRVGIVYVAQNKTNGMRYVGQTIYSFRERWSQPDDSPFGRALRKYGREGFEVYENEVPEELMDNLECSLIREYDSLVPNGYNFETGGHKNKHFHPTTKTLLSVMATERYADPTVRVAASVRQKEVQNREEVRAAVTAKALERYTDLARRAAVSARSTQQWTDPAARAAMSVAARRVQKEVQNRPEVKAAKAKAMRAAWARKKVTPGGYFEPSKGPTPLE
jgi:hypothetical protein